MGRRRTIDRDHLLDAAEAVIAREGAAGVVFRRRLHQFTGLAAVCA